MFRPTEDKLEIEPIEIIRVIEGDKSFVRAGKIIRDGVVTNDIVFFEDFGCVETAPDSQGKKHWVVHNTKEVILGYETEF